MTAWTYGAAVAHVMRFRRGIGWDSVCAYGPRLNPADWSDARDRFPLQHTWRDQGERPLLPWCSRCTRRVHDDTAAVLFGDDLEARLRAVISAYPLWVLEAELAGQLRSGDLWRRRP